MRTALFAVVISLDAHAFEIFKIFDASKAGSECSAGMAWSSQTDERRAAKRASRKRTRASDRVEARSVTPPNEPVSCTEDLHCSEGLTCVEGYCASSPPLPAREAPFRALECSAEVPCAGRQSCMNGVCVSPPPPAPASSLQRSGTELFVRERAVQLRQDLALGEGPVISTLALARGVSAAELGRTMRANRLRLAETIGDRADASWPARFLDLLDALPLASEERSISLR